MLMLTKKQNVFSKLLLIWLFIARHVADNWLIIYYSFSEEKSWAYQAS